MRYRAAVALACVLLAAPPAPAFGDTVTVQLERSRIVVEAGDELGFTATVRNGTDAPAAGLLAHLAITSVDGSTYVDPEDWSSERTQYLDALAAGGSTVTSWRMKAVGSGHFVVYVAVTGTGPDAQVVASRALRLDVTSRRTINPGSVLPVAVGVPAGVAALMLLVSLRRRRSRPRA